MSTELPTPVPEVSPDSKPFWDATAEHRLVLPRCLDCGSVNWYPRQICPACSSLNIEWMEASGRGEVYSFAINHRGGGPFRGHDFVLAYVTLEEGPTIMTNIIETEFDKIAIGSRVEVVFHDTGEGPALYRFRVTEGN